MRPCIRIINFIIAISISLYALPSLAQTGRANDNGPVEDRELKEESIPANYFDVALYKPTYILPYYYTGSPDNTVYLGNTPNNEQLSHPEIKYQFSFKVPLWKNIADYTSSLYLGYTQLSYWQLYASRPFFRETDYEPEIFIANELNWGLTKNWTFNTWNVGLSHQSNGYGNTLERSWNRFYVDAIFSTEHWMLGIKPWYILSTNGNNTNIAQYLGYAEVRLAYKVNQQVFSLQVHNLIEGAARRATAQATWSFPITPYIKGYLQIFSGYGQSLIEYNHRTNSAGIGIALNDWI